MSSILIVDDEVIFCLHLSERLNAWGHRVTMVHSGAEAVQLAIQTVPDLILMDIYLPGNMNGIDAAKIIQSQIESPVVFITGCDDHKWVDKAVQCLPAGYLHKPVSIAQLYAVVNIALINKTMPFLSEIRQNSGTSSINQREAQPGDQNQNYQQVNIEESVCSFLNKDIFSECTCNQNDIFHLQHVYLKEIVFPMVRKLSADGIRLSPTEMKVAVLVRLGKSTKQIADILCLSADTIHSHRKHIRKKIGITSSAFSLETYLCGLQEVFFIIFSPLYYFFPMILLI